ncbi:MULTISPECIES: carboxypeptidase-like regulatory domain-containing protein [unclassified Paraflavitalea]|uniref:carboxypeptidase-like regulatory domain-containing protein n=1 Tax=unclassified Paraflavitalea TaxID=2798305 RepID=UPI003D34E9D4
MRKKLLYTLLLAFLLPTVASAQFEKLKDSVIQIYGVVMTADSLMGIPYVTVQVKGRNQGTYTNDQGVFSIVVLKGDMLEFSSIGFKPKLIEIPRSLDGNQHSLIQLMVKDTVYLPATIIRPRPTREQFERDFVNVPVDDDEYEIARKNTEAGKRRILARSLPTDGRETGNMMLRNNASKYYYYGQAPPQNIFNPFAWNEFIKAWKRGDFKNKSDQ